MAILIPYFGIDNIRVMIFVDGENLAIRFGAYLRNEARVLARDVIYEPDVYVWSRHLSDSSVVAGGGVIRTHYYTAVQGDHPKVEDVASTLKQAGVGAPRVFKKIKNQRSKGVDISLATDMLTHAHRHHFDIAVLVGGDADFVPLVRAVQAEGRGVHLWYIPDGVSEALVQAVDKASNIVHMLVQPQPSPAT